MSGKREERADLVEQPGEPMLEAHADGNRRQEPHHDTQRREPQPFQDQHRLQAAGVGTNPRDA